MNTVPPFDLRPRRMKQKALLLVLVFLGLLGVRLERLIESYAGAQPIVVTFQGLSPAESDSVQVVAVSQKGYVLPLTLEIPSSADAPVSRTVATQTADRSRFAPMPGTESPSKSRPVRPLSGSAISPIGAKAH